MLLDILLDGVDVVEKYHYKNVDIEYLTNRSYECKNGTLFFVIKGMSVDGSQYVDEAISNGAIAIVTSNTIDGVDIPQIVVDNVRKCMSIVAKHFYLDAVDLLKVISIIGTAGKTTTSMIVSHIISSLDKKCGTIGTNGIWINGIRYDNTLTTPDPIDMHKIFLYMKNEGVEYVVMEVSAQSIYLDKMYGVYSDMGVYTNISNEHLDFFKTMSKYVYTKCRYFMKNNMQECVVNIDDEYVTNILENTDIHVSTYSIENVADIYAHSIRYSDSGSEYYIHYGGRDISISTTLVGRYNVYNTIASIITCIRLGFDIEKIVDTLSTIPQIKGRLEKYIVHGKTVIIDFAHTPDSIDKVLSTISHVYKKDMCIIFGAVGYSDSNKRMLMGRSVDKYSSKIILSSDNPGNTRFEDICKDIMQGISKDTSTICISDRESAIRYGIDSISKDTILVILGKGHEDFQKIGDIRVPYSDIEIIKKMQSE